MIKNRPAKGSLVLYKSRPAYVVERDGKKLVIQLPDGERQNVRPKDVIVLHPGPIHDLRDLTETEGEIDTAWELLVGGTTSLDELAELAYGEYTVKSAWATWQYVSDGLYFSGLPSSITVHSAADVEQEIASREVRAAQKADWQAFVNRMEQGIFIESDAPYLQDLEELALGRRESSRVLRDLGHNESPQVAHDFLLRLGYWNYSFNPYPERAGISVTPLAFDLPSIPDEPRRDLTHLRALAIDDEGSKDPDDALSVEGGRVWVHIADVASIISVDSPADIEARDRGENLYLPEGTVPMLPHVATERFGLGLAEKSPALSFGFTLDPAGAVRELEIVPSWVHVERLSYEEADELLNTHPLKELDRCAALFESRRRQGGAIFIQFPEVKVQAKNDDVRIDPLPALRSREVVREAMLMTGEGVANFAQEHDIPMPYSSQESTLDGVPYGGSLAEMFAIRRLLKPGKFSTSPAPHASLGMEMYVKTTSPLRRYLDLVVHQQLRAFLAGTELLSQADIMERIGAASAITGSVRWAERNSVTHWALVYLTQHPEWQGEGIVVGHQGASSIVLIPELGLETRIYSSKALALDMTVNLQLNTVNLSELEAHFQIRK